MKNLKSFLANVALIVLGALVYIFLGCANFIVKITLVNSSSNGYDLIKSGFEENADGKITAVAVSNVIICVLVGIVILIAILNLLASFGIIKNKKVCKILNFVGIGSAVIAMIFGLVAWICLGSYISENNLSDVASVGWATIVNFFVLIVIAISMFFAYMSLDTKSKKSKK